VGRDDLGGLELSWNGIANGVQIAPPDTQFFVGTGFDDALRLTLWQDRDALIGRAVTFEFRGIGSENRPRFPVFIGFRED
jgi:DNA ligase-1